MWLDGTREEVVNKNQYIRKLWYGDLLAIYETLETSLLVQSDNYIIYIIILIIYHYFVNGKATFVQSLLKITRNYRIYVSTAFLFLEGVLSRLIDWQKQAYNIQFSLQLLLSMWKLLALNSINLACVLKT